jgi:hypothetical protein
MWRYTCEFFPNFFYILNFVFRTTVAYAPRIKSAFPLQFLFQTNLYLRGIVYVLYIILVETNFEGSGMPMKYDDNINPSMVGPWERDQSCCLVLLGRVKEVPHQSTSQW